MARLAMIIILLSNAISSDSLENIIQDEITIESFDFTKCAAATDQDDYTPARCLDMLRTSKRMQCRDDVSKLHEDGNTVVTVSPNYSSIVLPKEILITCPAQRVCLDRLQSVPLLKGDQAQYLYQDAINTVWRVPSNILRNNINSIKYYECGVYTDEEEPIVVSSRVIEVKTESRPNKAPASALCTAKTSIDCQMLYLDDDTGELVADYYTPPELHGWSIHISHALYSVQDGSWRDSINHYKVVSCNASRCLYKHLHGQGTTTPKVLVLEIKEGEDIRRMWINVAESAVQSNQSSRDAIWILLACQLPFAASAIFVVSIVCALGLRRLHKIRDRACRYVEPQVLVKAGRTLKPSASSDSGYTTNDPEAQLNAEV